MILSLFALFVLSSNTSLVAAETFYYVILTLTFHHVSKVRVSHKHLSGGGSAALPIRVSTWCRKWREQSAQVNVQTSKIAFHTPMPLSLTYTKKKGDTPVKPKHKHVLSGYWRLLWKENCCVDCTRTMTQCMSLQGPDQGFKITLSSGAWDFSPTEGNGEFCWGNLIYMVVGTWGGVNLTIKTFFKAKNNIL